LGSVAICNHGFKLIRQAVSTSKACSTLINTWLGIHIVFKEDTVILEWSYDV